MNMKIVIIDSGINYRYKQLGLSGKHIYLKEGEICYDDNFYENGMHGTLVYYTIKSIFKELECYNIRILDKDGRTSSRVLVSALNYLLDVDCDIINVSMSTSSLEKFEEIRLICDKLEKQKKIIVASGDEQGKYVLPAMLDSVIGVSSNNYLKDEIRYNEGSYECMVNTEPEFIRIGEKKVSMFAGTSKGAAIVSGVIAEYLNNNYKTICKKEVVNLLKQKPLKYCLSYCCKKNEVLGYVEKKYGSQYAKIIYNKCCDSIENTIVFLNDIVNKYPNHRRIYYSDFSSMENIVDLIHSGWE